MFYLYHKNTAVPTGYCFTTNSEHKLTGGKIKIYHNLKSVTRIQLCNKVGLKKWCLTENEKVNSSAKAI